MSSFDSLKSKYLPLVEDELCGFLSSSAEHDRIDACARMAGYHLETGGKRLRALIPLYVYQILGKDPVAAVALGAAVEMIHNATLVHDDLQDGDEVRRERPTVWKKYSEAQAINCGDAMFYFAIRLLAKLDVDAASLVRLMDRASLSTLQVIEGQAQEFIMKDELYPTVERYLEVIRGKTSGLFSLPIVSALEALGVEERRCRIVEAAAMDLGMLFQIQDDLLDVYGNKGRDRVATDVAEGKVSILVAHVNACGTEQQKQELKAILSKPRRETTDADIQHALGIFEATHAKSAAIEKIRDIQKKIQNDSALAEFRQMRDLISELGDIFLEPLNGIL